MKITLNNAIWQTDYSGEEVGYEDIPVVGQYEVVMGGALFTFLINTENNEVLEIMEENK